MKNCNDIIGNRTRDVPVCSAVPEPTGQSMTAVWWAQGHSGVESIMSMKNLYRDFLPVPRTRIELWTLAARIVPPSNPSPLPLLSLVFLLRMNPSFGHSDPSLTAGSIKIRFRQWVPNSVQRASWGWSPLADVVVTSRRF
jgi:hypothetical protein